MKKIKSKLTRKRPEVKKPTRITNETVAEHREQILAGGRRFKYPVQYTRHRLVINAAIIGVVALLLFLLFCWWQLYKAQTTSDFFYRLVRIVPVPVANVDGEEVKYGDYLLNYKSNETYINTVEKADQAEYAEGKNGQTQYDFHKAWAMNSAVDDAYAGKLARERGITVTDQQVDEAIRLQRKITSSQDEVSQEAFERSIERMYGLSLADIKQRIEKSILRQAVAYDIDENAREASRVVADAIKKDSKKSFEKIVQETKKKYPDTQLLVSGWVNKSNPDGGITAAASKLKEGETSGPIKPLQGGGYYFVRLVSTNKDGEINYESIKIPLGEFTKRLAELKADNKIQYYIDVPEVRPQVQQ